jgi:hypothetical protein
VLPSKLNTTKMPLYSTKIKCIEINHTECFTIVITISNPSVCHATPFIFIPTTKTTEVVTRGQELS